MLFKDSHQKIKKIYRKVEKIVSYACIVILVIIAVFFVDYFIESNIAKSKGKTYVPRYSLYTIISPSMVPNINVYDVIFDVKITDPSKIKKGDVITFVSTSAISKGMTVTHRVAKVLKTEKGYEYYTKGDANMFIDGATAKSENLIGKVVFKIPQLGRVQFFLSSKIGWLMCIILPAIGIVIYDVLKLTKAMKLNNKSKDISIPVELPKASSVEIKQNILNNATIVNANLPMAINVTQNSQPIKTTIELPKINKDFELPKSTIPVDLPKLK